MSVSSIKAKANSLNTFLYLRYVLSETIQEQLKDCVILNDGIGGVALTQKILNKLQLN